MTRARIRLGLGLAVMALPALAPQASAAPAPFGRECTPQNGVRFCGGTDATRVPTFDGVPLDVDVTLPPSGDGPFPTIVMLHGYSGSKTDFQHASPEGGDSGGSRLYHWNNTYFAQRGYAVVNYSARGFGRSCGRPDSRTHPGCLQGWVHLGDQRYEARDTQYLLGLLADQGIVKPDAIGVTGISYGGGQTIELAFLRDRIRKLPSEGSGFAPWTSPGGRALRIAAAYPRWPWSDLVYSLEPNGRFLDFELPGSGDSRKPLGVAKASFVEGLFATGFGAGFYAPPGADPNADLTTWNARVMAGEPEDSTATAIADEIHNFHQGYGIPGEPAPLLIQNGWTDDLFPAVEALRVYNHVRGRYPSVPVSLQFADLGHQRGSNKRNANLVFQDQGSDFFDAYLKGAGNPPAPGSVTAFTQTCPQDAPAGGPFRAQSWHGIHPGAVVFGGRDAQTVTSSGGNPATASAMDPVAGGGDACRTVAKETASGTAVYTAQRSRGFTMVGLPTVTAEIETSGRFGQLAARLWDVAPDGKQTLVSRGVYRLLDDQKGRITFQLFGNGWRFEPGHEPKLELLGRDPPFLRPSNGSFSVRVSKLSVELPTIERPGSARGQVGARSAGCLRSRGKVGSRGIGRLRLGHSARRTQSRAGLSTTAQGRYVHRYCVAGGGEIIAAFSRRGDARLIATTARGYSTRGVRPGMRLRSLLQHYRGRPLVRSGRGLYRAPGRSTRLIFGVRRGKVTFVGVTGRRQVKSAAKLRFYVKRAGVR